MTQINRQILKLMANDIESALQSVAKKYNVEMKYNGGRFTSNNATIKIEISTINDNGELITREANDFKSLAKFYGLSADLYGKSFTTHKDTYKIVGLKSKSHKYPILCERSDGKIFKFPASTVALLTKKI